MGLRLIITRPLEDAKSLADELDAIDVQHLIAPLLVIQASGKKMPNLVGVQALLLTSANGVRAFARLSKERNLPIYAVGNASALAAQKEGFKNIECAGGDVKTLAELVCERLDFKNGAVLHIAGSIMAGDLAGALSQKGFNYRRLKLYHAKTVDALPLNCMNAIKNSLVGGVVLYSPRTAKTFLSLLVKAKLNDHSKQLIAFCLSKAVAKQIVAYDWKNVVVAKTPDQNSLIRCVKEYVTLGDSTKLEL